MGDIMELILKEPFVHGDLKKGRPVRNCKVLGVIPVKPTAITRVFTVLSPNT